MPALLANHRDTWRGAPVTFRSWPALVKPPECRGCPHEHKGRSFVPGAGDIDNAQILAVFERPGRNEADDGVPLVGRTGKVVEDALRGWRGVYRTNVRKCLVEEECSTEETQRAIDHCSRYLAEEVARITQSGKCQVVLLGGAEAAAAFGHQGETQQWSGAVLRREEFEAMVQAGMFALSGEEGDAE